MPLEAADLARRMAEAGALAAEFDSRAAHHDWEGSLAVENLARLRSAGWAGLTVPLNRGGAGAGLEDTALLLSALARGCGSTALGFAMHLQTVATGAAQVWRGTAYADLCADILARGALVNSCASEPELGSPSRGGLPRTTARREGAGQWRIDGHKTFASLAPDLAWVIVPAALEGEPEQIGRFLVPSAALRIQGSWDVMAMRATGSQDLILDAVLVPDAALLYRESAAVRRPGEVRAAPWFTLLCSAVYLGVAEAALELAGRLALGRVPTALGRPIASLEPLQRRLGTGALELFAARRVLMGVARDWDQGSPALRDAMNDEVVAAKLLVARAALGATDQAMLVPGGSALRRELGLERRFRDARAAPYHPPSEDQGLARLGRRLLEGITSMDRQA